MKTKWMVLVLGGVSGIALTAAVARSADLQPLVVTGLAGALRIQQSVPCGSDVDQTTPVTSGRIEISPATGIDVPGGKRFVLTRANVTFAPFSISRSCLGVSETRNYTEIGVQLAQITSVTATPVGGGIYAVTIPKSDFLISEATIVNDKLEAGFKYPSEDVTGTIDLAHGTVQMRVVMATKVHFKGGCFGIGCVIDEYRDGTLTAEISGRGAFPDSDGDGIPDQFDNCPYTSNPDQKPVASPIVMPPPALTIASCADQRIGVATGLDVCDALVVSVTGVMPGATFKPGRNLVTWTGQDAQGRVGTAVQTVTVADKTPPDFTFIPPDRTVKTCGAVALGLPTVTDDCAGKPTLTNNAPKWFGVGTTPVTWTARDVAGNPTIATQMVTVRDTVRPSVACVPTGASTGSFQVSSTDACTASPAIRLGDVSLADGETITIAETDQSGVTVVIDKDGKHFSVGKGEAVISATDGSGNVASASCVVPR